MKAKKQSNKTSVKEKKVPYQYKPDNMSYYQWQISLRRQFGIKQEFSYKNVGNLSSDNYNARIGSMWQLQAY